MPLFRKPKEEGLKSLSEKDIQQRLYGFFHQDRSIQVAPPTKKTSKAVDLRSLEVTPAGIMQTDLFRSETQSRAVAEEEKPETVLNEKRFEPKRSSFAPEAISSVEAEEIVRKQSTSTTRRPAARKTKKDKKRSEAFKKFTILALEKTWAASKIVFSWITRTFSSFVLWLSESRGGESRRVPAKFVLVSLAVIGTGLIFFNVWSSRMKQHASNPVSAVQKTVITRVVPVNNDVLSRPAAQDAELSVPVAQVAPQKKYFSIQVCVAQSQDGAATIVRKLRGGGLPAFYDASTSKRGARIFKIMLGKFDNFQAAKQQLESFKKNKVMEPYQDSFIRNLNTQR